MEMRDVGIKAVQVNSRMTARQNKQLRDLVRSEDYLSSVWCQIWLRAIDRVTL